MASSSASKVVQGVSCSLLVSVSFSVACSASPLHPPPPQTRLTSSRHPIDPFTSYSMKVAFAAESHESRFSQSQQSLTKSEIASELDYGTLILNHKAKSCKLVGASIGGVLDDDVYEGEFSAGGKGGGRWRSRWSDRKRQIQKKRERKLIQLTSTPHSNSIQRSHGKPDLV